MVLGVGKDKLCFVYGENTKASTLTWFNMQRQKQSTRAGLKSFSTHAKIISGAVVRGVDVVPSEIQDGFEESFNGNSTMENILEPKQ